MVILGLILSIKTFLSKVDMDCNDVWSAIQSRVDMDRNDVWSVMQSKADIEREALCGLFTLDL